MFPFFLLFFCLLAHPVFSLNLSKEAPWLEKIPVQYQGRIRPLNAVIALNQQNNLTMEALLEELQLKNSPFFILLPRYSDENWLPLAAVDSLERSSNFTGNITGYSDAQFLALRQLYRKITAEKSLGEWKSLATALLQSYQEAQLQNSTLPSFWRIEVEYNYYQYPWVKTTLTAYFLALIAFILAWSLAAKKIQQIGIALLCCAFLLHTLILLMRCLILWRPPVSNMDETLLFIPWIAVISMGIFWTFSRDLRLLLAGTLTAFSLLTIAMIKGMDSGLENTQAVLNSHYWLTVHVLMIVGSYGIFFVNAVLAHFYLVRFLIHKQAPQDTLAWLVLQTMYIGVGLLIPGTILGGVWAAESWGRFWDWDPKESWAFISICSYLVVIHAHHFHYVKEIGLAIGAIIGFQAITFTWYGVNYILGTGLHTYGFGSGGIIYYFLFSLIEVAFIMSVLVRCKKFGILQKSTVKK